MLLSEMFGVERDTDFRVKGYETRFRLTLNVSGFEHLKIKRSGSDVWETPLIGTIFNVISVAPSGIIHLPPPLTDEQRAVLMSLFTMGARYMGMTPDGWKRCFVNKLKKEANTWIFGEIADMQMLSIAPKMANCLDTLINLSDPEPFDIGKALGVGE